jgi:gluconate 5-dehydrogenase
MNRFCRGEQMTDRFSLKGCVALVTGASRGLGLAMAEALADHGARVVRNGRDPETLRSTAARITNAEFLAFDVCDAKAGPAAIADIVNRYGKLDKMQEFSIAARSRNGKMAISSGSLPPI